MTPRVIPSKELAIEPIEEELDFAQNPVMNISSSLRPCESDSLVWSTTVGRLHSQLAAVFPDDDQICTRI